MAVLKGILKESRDHYRQVEKQIRKRLNELPKGSLYVRKIRGKPYFYLNFRQGKKVIQKYIGKEKPVALLKEIEERKQLKKQLKEARKNLKLLSQALKKDSRG